MSPAGRPGRASAIGVVDAGVVLTRLDAARRSHQAVAMLFERSARRRVSLHISAVNLAEAIEHARDYTRETGTDVVSLLESFGIAIHSPGVEAARKAAALAFLRSLSMADRFAAGTAELLGARLYTTDSALAAALRKRRVAPPVTLF